MSDRNQAIIVVAVVLSMFSTALFCLAVLDKMERMVTIAERTEKKADKIIESTAPIREVATRVSMNMLDSMEKESLGESAVRGMKEIGEAAKKRAVEILENTEQAQPKATQ